MAALAELIADRRSGSGLVLAAIAQAEVLALGAFDAGNGVVARGISRVLLIARGVDPKAVSAPDVGHWELRTEYESALTAYAAGDPVPWIVHCAEAIRLGAVESIAVCEATLRAGEAGSP